MSTRDVVIVSGCRTAVGTFGGALKDVTAVELATVAVREAVRRAGIRPDQVDEVILGCILQAGLGMNPARQATIKAGLPDSVPATTVNKVCGSGLKAVMLAAQAIRCGDAEVIVAGGTESLSRAPYLLPGARWGERLGHGKVLDHMIHEGLTDAFHDIHMGITAENLAERYAIGRAEQDAFAAESQARAEAAIREGRFKTEIVAVPIPQEKGDPKPFDTDEHPRAGTTPRQAQRQHDRVFVPPEPAEHVHGAVDGGDAGRGVRQGAGANRGLEVRLDDVGGAGVVGFGARAEFGGDAALQFGWASGADFELGLGADDREFDGGEALEARTVNLVVGNRVVLGAGFVGFEEPGEGACDVVGVRG